MSSSTGSSFNITAQDLTGWLKCSQNGSSFNRMAQANAGSRKAYSHDGSSPFGILTCTLQVAQCDCPICIMQVLICILQVLICIMRVLPCIMQVLTFHNFGSCTTQLSDLHSASLHLQPPALCRFHGCTVQVAS